MYHVNTLSIENKEYKKTNMATKDQAIPLREGRKVVEEGGINNKEHNVFYGHQRSGPSQVEVQERKVKKYKK